MYLIHIWIRYINGQCKKKSNLDYILTLKYIKEINFILFIIIIRWYVLLSGYSVFGIIVNVT